jgi:hypothetical protein
VVGVGELVGVKVGVLVFFGVGVAVSRGVGVAVLLGVGVDVFFGVGVLVFFGVGVAVFLGVGVEVSPGVGVAEGRAQELCPSAGLASPHSFFEVTSHLYVCPGSELNCICVVSESTSSSLITEEPLSVISVTT